MTKKAILIGFFCFLYFLFEFAKAKRTIKNGPFVSGFNCGVVFLGMITYIEN